MLGQIDFLLRKRVLFFIASILLLVVCFSGFKQFVFDGSPRIYFDEGYLPFEQFLEMEDTYGRDFRVVFMLSAKEGDFFDKDNVAELIEMTEAAWQIPLVRRVDSLTNYQYTYSADDELYVEDYLTPDILDDTAILADRRKSALNDAELIDRVLSKDGKHALVVAYLTMTAEQAQGTDAAQVVDAAYQLQQKIHEENSNMSVHINGNLVSSYHNVEVATNDVKIMIPFMFALMFVILGVLLRSVFAVVVSLIISMCAAVGALGFAALIGIIFSPLAINALMISITVSMAHCIHIFTQFFHEFKTKPKMEALAASLKINFFAVSMTSITTMIGFLSLNTNDLPPAVALGNTAAIGTALAWLFSFTMLPFLVWIMPFKARADRDSLLEKVMGAFAELLIRYKNFVLVSMVALCVLMTYLSFSNQLNDYLAETLHKPHKFRTATDAIDQHFGSMYITNYDLKAKDEGGIADPEYLKEMDRMARFLRTLPDVSNVYAFSDTIKRLNKSMHDDDPAYYRIPDDRELIAQYILLYEMSVPYGLDLSNQITADKSKSLMVVSSPSMDTQTTIKLDKTINNWIEQNLPDYMKTTGISLSAIWSYLTEDSLTNSLKGAVVALTIISGLILMMLRSVRYGLVSLVPNLLPAAFGFGVWFIYSGHVGLALTCVLILTIGIVVDDTVHFLVKYKNALKEHKGDAELAVRSTFKQVGPALLITTLVLGGGFSVLCLSQTIINSALGLVTAVILFAAFILDVLLLPVLLMILDRNRKQEYE